jgi:hypothetical protein
MRWINRQTRFDLDAQRAALGAALEDIRPLQTA